MSVETVLGILERFHVAYGGRPKSIRVQRVSWLVVSRPPASGSVRRGLEEDQASDNPTALRLAQEWGMLCLCCRSLRQPTHLNIAFSRGAHLRRPCRVCRPTEPGAGMIRARLPTSSSGTRGMPVLTKADLREHQPAGFVPDGRDLGSALARGEVELVKTSGSTSDAVTNVWCQEWWNASEASSWKLHAATASARLGDHREAILSSPRCVGFASEVGYLSMGQRTLRRFSLSDRKGRSGRMERDFLRSND